jgi:hypothetical protein
MHWLFASAVWTLAKGAKNAKNAKGKKWPGAR